MNKMKKSKIAIATGGTGGHIFPAIALVEMLNMDEQEHLILADNRFLNFKSQFPENLNYKIINSSSLSGNIILKILGVLRIFVGISQALFMMFKFRPNLLVSFGGYPSFPTMIAAIIARVPILIHEPNSIVGRASKVFLKFAKAVSVSFKGTNGLRSLDKKKLFYTGTPIRSKLLEARKISYPALGDKDKIHILILGGSQGAKVFSEVIPNAIVLLEEKLKKKLFLHQQSRAESLQEIKDFYKKNKIQAEIKSFFDNIGQEFAKAHLIISRSGALTVSELIAVGRPAILIPFPFAMDNHQFFNAKELEKNKVATIILEKDFTAEKLKLTLQNILSNKPALTASAVFARKMFNDWNNSFYRLMKTCVQECDDHGKFN
jgi:UDP-N-acetylglucosamine--N-acetylmuramyl-(pentapeptide) pyrophosphoryl-undecaprenol N-acetylglucosamine transferase